MNSAEFARKRLMTREFCGGKPGERCLKAAACIGAPFAVRHQTKSVRQRGQHAPTYFNSIHCLGTNLCGDTRQICGCWRQSGADLRRCTWYVAKRKQALAPFAGRHARRSAQMAATREDLNQHLERRSARAYLTALTLRALAHEWRDLTQCDGVESVARCYRALLLSSVCRPSASLNCCLVSSSHHSRLHSTLSRLAWSSMKHTRISWLGSATTARHTQACRRRRVLGASASHRRAQAP